MAVRSRRLFGPTAVAMGASVSLYTVPADRTLILRTIIVGNPSTSAARTFRLTLNGSGTTNQKVTDVLSVPAGGALELAEKWWALNPADSLWGAAISGSLNFWGFGSLLAGAPA